MTPKFPPDLLPSLHKVSQTRHFSLIKSYFATLELLVDDMPIFICPEPRGPTELLKNAKNRFQIGLVFPGRWHKYRNLVIARVVFSKRTLAEPGITTAGKFLRVAVETGRVIGAAESVAGRSLIRSHWPLLQSSLDINADMKTFGWSMVVHMPLHNLPSHRGLVVRYYTGTGHF